MAKLHYSSNNSGGGWWLKDADWHAMAGAGWDVEWYADETESLFKADKDGRWLGALASRASIETDDPDATIAEWERLTGQNSTDEGCNCCGEPHNFTYEDDAGNTLYSNVEVVQTRRNWS